MRVYIVRSADTGMVLRGFVSPSKKDAYVSEKTSVVADEVEVDEEPEPAPPNQELKGINLLIRANFFIPLDGVPSQDKKDRAYDQICSQLRAEFGPKVSPLPELVSYTFLDQEGLPIAEQAD